MTDEIKAAIGFLEQTPERLRRLLAGLSEPQLRFRLRPDAFSIKETVLHLRDIEIEGYARRLRCILNEETPLLADIDGTQLALDRRYNEQQVAPALGEFAASRMENVSLLRTITARDLMRTAEMEKVGRISLAQLIEMWREHDAGHWAEFEELRRVVETIV